jgi:hypothetical protein
LWCGVGQVADHDHHESGALDRRLGDPVREVDTARIGAALGLPWLKVRLGPDRLGAAGTLGTAVAMVLFAMARDAPTALVGSVVAGASWIAVLAMAPLIKAKRIEGSD